MSPCCNTSEVHTHTETHLSPYLRMYCVKLIVGMCGTKHTNYLAGVCMFFFLLSRWRAGEVWELRALTAELKPALIIFGNSSSFTSISSWHLWSSSSFIGDSWLHNRIIWSCRPTFRPFILICILMQRSGKGLWYSNILTLIEMYERNTLEFMCMHKFTHLNFFFFYACEVFWI